jgi:hypothetical protein
MIDPMYTRPSATTNTNGSLVVYVSNDLVAECGLALRVSLYPHWLLDGLIWPTAAWRRSRRIAPMLTGVWLGCSRVRRSQRTLCFRDWAASEFETSSYPLTLYGYDLMPDSWSADGRFLRAVESYILRTDSALPWNLSAAACYAKTTAVRDKLID